MGGGAGSGSSVLGGGGGNSGVWTGALPSMVNRVAVSRVAAVTVPRAVASWPKPSRWPISCISTLSRSMRPYAGLAAEALSEPSALWPVYSASSPGVGSMNQPWPAALTSMITTLPMVWASAWPLRSPTTNTTPWRADQMSAPPKACDQRSTAAATIGSSCAWVTFASAGAWMAATVAAIRLSGVASLNRESLVLSVKSLKVAAPPRTIVPKAPSTSTALNAWPTTALSSTMTLTVEPASEISRRWSCAGSITNAAWASTVHAPRALWPIRTFWPTMSSSTNLKSVGEYRSNTKPAVAVVLIIAVSSVRAF